MISLTGLCLSTQSATKVLRYPRYLWSLLLPGYAAKLLPGQSLVHLFITPLFFTLWWAYALYRYYQATGDKEFVLEQQLPLMRHVIKWPGKYVMVSLDVDSPLAATSMCS